jgi:Adenine-specific methyltransferase EcoRI
MTRKVLNRSFADANLAKEDEFYTQLTDIEKELRHYKKHFKGKVVYCNCDDPRVSNFFHYFSYNFEKLGLRKLITTCYKSQNADLFSQNDSEQSIYLEYEGEKDGNNVPDPEEIGIKPLRSDGDFRSAESVELLQQADIVVTNHRSRCSASSSCSWSSTIRSSCSSAITCTPVQGRQVGRPEAGGRDHGPDDRR